MIQPVFPQDEDEQTKHHPKDDSYLLKHRHARKLQPVSPELVAPHAHANHAANTHVIENPAVELIRQKVNALYEQEPDAKAEVMQAQEQPPAQPLSQHQRFMRDLSTSGKSLAQIQTEWHNYYVNLPDTEKHTVWQEFYSTHSQRTSAYTQHVMAEAETQAQPQPEPEQPQPPKPMVLSQPSFPKLSESQAAKGKAHSDIPTTTLTHQAETSGKKSPAERRDRRSPAGIKKHLLSQVAANSKRAAKAKQHFQSLLFGLVTGALTLLIFFFGFFNEVIIAPFIQPSRHVSATPIIVDGDSVAPSETPEVIIPKINVQLPVVYDVTSMAEADIQTGLERGVVHYPTTVLPGQQGNAAIFGHSSNNLFNKGKYKFAFVLLRQLVPGDIFYITYDKKVYSYRVFDKKIVTPSEVSVLNAVEGKQATATLITCDPPGTSTNRLVIWGEQISPDPNTATAPTTPTVDNSATPEALPSEGPKLWERLWNAIF